jgi:hypothetical protein
MDTSRFRAVTLSAKPFRLALAGCAALIALGAGGAQAQFFDPFDDMLPPRAVVWRLNDRGFTEITRPRFDGRAYVVEATDRYGDRVRLFVDSQDGAVLGRQRIGAPPVAVIRTRPGYGYTDADIETRGPVPGTGRMGPPAALPGADPVGRAPGPDRNALGLNPDARPRPEPQRKVARLTPPAKPAAPRATPEAPKPAETIAAPTAAKPEAPSAALEAPKVDVPKTEPVQSAPPAVAAEKPAAEKPPTEPAQAWRDPPPDQKRPVRVIGGATVVPGTAEKDQPAGE